MKSIITVAIVLAALVPAALYAGYIQPAPVTIQVDLGTGTGFALGDQWTARNSKGNSEFIGCGTRSEDDGVSSPSEFGFCQAGDADGVMLFCATASPTLINAMRAAASFSFYQFEVTNVVLVAPGPEDDPDEVSYEGECTRVGVSTQSFYLFKG
jgi:hypothetical protein